MMERSAVGLGLGLTTEFIGFSFCSLLVAVASIFTMCNGTAIYFVHSFEVSIAASGAIGFFCMVFPPSLRGLGRLVE
jgi:hypothetical protein